MFVTGQNTDTEVSSVSDETYWKEWEESGWVTETLNDCLHQETNAKNRETLTMDGGEETLEGLETGGERTQG